MDASTGHGCPVLTGAWTRPARCVRGAPARPTDRHDRDHQQERGQNVAKAGPRAYRRTSANVALCCTHSKMLFYLINLWVQHNARLADVRRTLRPWPGLCFWPRSCVVSVVQVGRAGAPQIPLLLYFRRGSMRGTQSPSYRISSIYGGGLGSATHSAVVFHGEGGLAARIAASTFRSLPQGLRTAASWSASHEP